jgi:acetolactate synthase small subunit
MAHEIEESIREHFEISIRFRNMIEQRIVRLEFDAARDELEAKRLQNPDHIRRQMRLVAAQLEEANRMKRFIENSRARVSDGKG